MWGLLFINLFIGLLLAGIGLCIYKYPKILTSPKKPDQKTVILYKKTFVYSGGIIIITSLLFFLLRWSMGMMICMFFLPLLACLFLLIKTEDLSTGRGKAGVAIYLALIIGIPAFIAYGMTTPSIQWKEDRMQITGLYGCSIPYHEIDSVEVLASMPRIQARTNGFSFGGVHKGYFKLKQQDTAKLYLKTTRGPLIQITTRAGKRFIINHVNHYTIPGIYDEIIRHQKR